jgi:hypothetical protein
MAHLGGRTMTQLLRYHVARTVALVLILTIAGLVFQ